MRIFEVSKIEKSEKSIKKSVRDKRNELPSLCRCLPS